MSSPVTVRAMTRADLPVVAKLAAELVRWHHAVDPARFFRAEPVEEGYARFFGSELGDARAVLVCAESDGDIVGYAYARLEPRDWNLLLDEHGALHDVLVDERARRKGVGAALVREACRRVEALGAKRVVLSTAVQNTGAQALFARLGFRPTMIEMTRERDGA